MIASLPMYWRAENAHLWRAFWNHVQQAAVQEGVSLPDLMAPTDLPANWMDHWRDPSLVLSQTCSLPFRTALRDQVTYVGTLTFDLKAAKGHYFSRIITHTAPHSAERAQPVKQMRLAYNAADSQSGWAVTQLAAPFGAPPAFHSCLRTGAHAASLAAVAEGQADIAYIDAVTWRILKRTDPNAARVYLMGKSAATPALPLITAKGNDPEPLRRALRAALTGIDTQDPLAPINPLFQIEDPCLMGGPLGFVVLEPEAYLNLPIPAPPPER